MNIVLINHYAGSPDMGMEFRPYYMAREWIKLGHKVTIIAGDYSHLRAKNPTINHDFEKEEIDEIDYYWVKTGQYEGNGVKRAITMARFVSKLWRKAKWIAKELKPDVVITSSTYPIDTYAGQRIAKKSGAKLIHEVHDMWPSTLIELGGMPKYHPFVVVMQIGENSAYKHSDKVVSLAPYAKEYMMKHGLREDKFVYITNGIVLDDWMKPQELPKQHEQVLNQLRQEGKFVVGYFGGHALSNALDILLEVAKKFCDDARVEFVLVGDGVEKQRLQQKALDIGLKNVCFLPAIPKYSVPKLLEKFDCSYIGCMDSPLYRFGIAMNKIFDSMMGGKPLLYAVNAPNNYAEEYNCGISVDSGDVNALAEAIVQLMKMSKEEQIRMGQNGHQAVLEHFEYSVLAKEFLEAMK